MINRTLLFGAVFLAAALVFVSAGCIGSQQTYTVGVDAGLSPWESVTSDGKPQGAVIDLLHLIAKDQEIAFVYAVPENGLWEQALQSGEIDTEGTIVITPERENLYDFVRMPFDPTRYTVIARDDSGVVLEDVLAGKVSISLFANSVYEQWAKTQFGEEYPRMLADGRIVLKKYADDLAFSVLSREVDAAIAGSSTMSTHLSRYMPLKFVGYVGEPRELGFVLRKNDTVLQEKLRAGIQNVRSAPAFRTILNTYGLQSKKDSYVVGIDGDKYPWTLMDANGTCSGYDVEQIAWIAQQKGFNVSFKAEGIEAGMVDVVTGDIDMWAGSMEITPERREYVAFSNPYYTSGDSKMGIALGNGNIILQDLINSGLAEFERSGMKAELLKKYGL